MHKFAGRAYHLMNGRTTDDDDDDGRPPPPTTHHHPKLLTTTYHHLPPPTTTYDLSPPTTNDRYNGHDRASVSGSTVHLRSILSAITASKKKK